MDAPRPGAWQWRPTRRPPGESGGIGRGRSSGEHRRATRPPTPSTHTQEPCPIGVCYVRVQVQSHRSWYRIVLNADILDPDRAEDVRDSGSLEETLQTMRDFLSAFGP